MKLSDELKHCLGGSGCKDCEYWERDIKTTCRGLLEKAYERIKRYEDMGEQHKMERLTRRELWWRQDGKTEKSIDYKVDEERRCVTHEGSTDFLIADKLAEYEDLEEQGKLLKLPCKVGDTVWDNDFGQPCSYTVAGFSIGKIDYDEENDIKGLQMYYQNYNGSIRCSCAVSEIGKTVFITRESALQKMNEMEGKE